MVPHDLVWATFQLDFEMNESVASSAVAGEDGMELEPGVASEAA